MTVRTTVVPTRDYDREFVTPVDFRVRRRVGFDTDRGNVTRFVVQLEYEVHDEWLEVVRFDHDPDSAHGHNVRTDGVHMDVYRDGIRVRREVVFPPISPNNAFTLAEEHLAEYARQYVERFAKWHGIENP